MAVQPTPTPPPGPDVISRVYEGLIVAVASAAATLLGAAYQWWSGRRKEKREDVKAKTDDESASATAMKSISEASGSSAEAYERLLTRMTQELDRIDVRMKAVQKENDDLRIQIVLLHKTCEEATLKAKELLGLNKELADQNTFLLAEINQMKREIKNGNAR